MSSIAGRISWGQHWDERYVVYRDNDGPRYELGHFDDEQECLMWALSYVLDCANRDITALLSVYDRHAGKWVVESNAGLPEERSA